jgi:hypothetical protein
VDLGAQLLLGLGADGVDYCLRKRLESIFFVGVNGHLRGTQVPYVLQHIDGVGQSLQIVVHLVQLELVSANVLQEGIVVNSVPVEESTPSRSLGVDLPVADQGQSLIQHQNLVDLLHLEHVVLTQIQTVVYNRLSNRVVTSREAVQNRSDQLLRRVVGCVLLFHRVEGLHANFDDSRDLFAGVAIDQHYPLVDQEFLALEFDFNGFEHLDRPDDVREHVLAHFAAIVLNQQKQ